MDVLVPAPSAREVLSRLAAHGRDLSGRTTRLTVRDELVHLRTCAPSARRTDEVDLRVLLDWDGAPCCLGDVSALDGKLRNALGRAVVRTASALLKAEARLLARAVPSDVPSALEVLFEDSFRAHVLTRLEFEGELYGLDPAVGELVAEIGADPALRARTGAAHALLASGDAHDRFFQGVLDVRGRSLPSSSPPWVLVWLSYGEPLQVLCELEHPYVRGSLLHHGTGRSLLVLPPATWLAWNLLEPRLRDHLPSGAVVSFAGTADQAEVAAQLAADLASTGEHVSLANLSALAQNVLSV